MKKFQTKLVGIVLMILIVACILPIQVFANEEGLQIIKTAEEDYIIYIKELQKEQFEFGITQSPDVDEININYRVSELDNAGNNVVFITKEKYETISEQENYLFVKKDDKVLIKGEKIDFTKAFTNEKIQEVEKITKKIKTELITDIIKKDEEIDGVKVKVTVGGLKITSNDNSNYYYAITKLPADNYNELKKLAYRINDDYSKLDMYSKIELAQQFYNIYESLIKVQNWREVENYTIIQPDDAQKGENFVVYLKEIDKEGKETIDVKFLTSYREDEEEKIAATVEQKIVKETAKLPVTGDSIVLFIILLVLVILTIIVFIRMKKIEKQK